MSRLFCIAFAFAAFAVLAAAQPLDPEGDEHGAQRRVGRREGDRDGKQGPRDGLAAISDLYDLFHLPG